MPEDATLTKFAQLRGLYGKYQLQIREDRRYYDLDFAADVLSAGARARGFKEVIPRTARRAIDEAVDHILYMPKVRMPVRPTESELVTQQEIAEKKRKAAGAYWRQITQRNNPLGDGRKWILLDGMIAIKHKLRFDLLPDHDDPDYKAKLDKLGRYEFMWEHELLNAEWVYPDPSDHRNPQYVYVNYSLRKEQAARDFPKRVSGAMGEEWRTRNDYDQVNYLEYWTAPEWNDDGTWEPGEYKIYIDQELVHDAENPYPYVPIAIEDSGYGLVHKAVEPELKFVGLIHHSLSVFLAQARQWSAMEAVAELTAFNPIEARNMSPEQLKRLDIAPGAIWELEGNPAVDSDAQIVTPGKWPDIPLTVPQMIQLTDREVNSSTKADTLGGMPQKGVDTATEADQNVRNSAAKLQGPVAALERLAAKLTRWFFMDIELVLEAPVTLYGSGADDPADIRLTPREISGYYDCFVQLRTTDEEAADMTRARFWGEMYRVLPFLSAWTAMEAGGISDDPLAEMLRRAGEDVFLSEEFRQIRIATGAQSFGELALMIQQMQAQKPAAGGGGAGSDLSLVTQDDINSPVQSRITSDALDARDTNQAASMGRGPQSAGGSSGY